MVRAWGELGAGFVEVFRKAVEVERQRRIELRGVRVGEVGIGADVEGHVVGVDGVGDVPVPLGVAGVLAGERDLRNEAAVRDVGERVGDRDGEIHAVLRLFAPLVFAGPEDGAAVVFVGGEDPGAAGGIGLEGHAAEPPLGDGVAGVIDVDSVRLAFAESVGEIDEEGAASRGCTGAACCVPARKMLSTARVSVRSSWTRVASDSMRKRTVFLPAMDLASGSTLRSRW